MLLEVKNLSFSYGERKILDDISFTLEGGECLFLLGANGQGKTTLLGTLIGTHKVKEGEIQKPNRIAYVPQDVDFPDMTVFDCVLLGRRQFMKFDMSKEDYEITAKIIQELGLESYALRSASTLSGGEKQMVAIARALTQEASVLLMDEPTSNLDVKHQLSVLSFLKKLAKDRGMGIVIVMHDLSLAMKYGDKFVILKDGKVVGREFTPQIIKDAFGVNIKIIEHEEQKILSMEES